MDAQFRLWANGVVVACAYVWKADAHATSCSGCGISVIWHLRKEQLLLACEVTQELMKEHLRRTCSRKSCEGVHSGSEPNSDLRYGQGLTLKWNLVPYLILVHPGTEVISSTA